MLAGYLSPFYLTQLVGSNRIDEPLHEYLRRSEAQDPGSCHYESMIDNGGDVARSTHSVTVTQRHNSESWIRHVVRLDADRGFLPAHVEYQGNSWPKPAVCQAVDVKELTAVDLMQPLWCVTEWSLAGGLVGAWGETRVENILIHPDAAEGSPIPDFPNGTEVTDQVRGRTYVTGGTKSVQKTRDETIVNDGKERPRPTPHPDQVPGPGGPL